MALTLQRKLELAGDLAKVQPLLRQLGIMKKPKKHGVRNVIVLVSGVIAVLALVAMLRRRSRRPDTVGDDDETWVNPQTEEGWPTVGDPESGSA